MENPRWAICSSNSFKTDTEANTRRRKRTENVEDNKKERKKDQTSAEPGWNPWKPCVGANNSMPVLLGRNASQIKSGRGETIKKCGCVGDGPRQVALAAGRPNRWQQTSVDSGRRAVSRQSPRSVRRGSVCRRRRYRRRRRVQHRTSPADDRWVRRPGWQSRRKRRPLTPLAPFRS